MQEQLLTIRYNNFVNDKGHEAKYKPPCKRTQYNMKSKLELEARATNSCQTEARDLAHRCPYTYISAATNFLAMELAYGAPVTSVQP